MTNRWPLGFIAGVGIGVGLGLLFAPKSGQETRRNLRRAANDALDTANDAVDEISSRGRTMAKRLQRAAQDVHSSVRDTIETGKSALEDLGHV
jgi:gas vesicle protein